MATTTDTQSQDKTAEGEVKTDPSEGKFPKLSSIGDSLRSLSKSDSSAPKQGDSENSEPDIMSKTLSTMESLGKVMLEDDPRPKTRFQRIKDGEPLAVPTQTPAINTSPLKNLLTKQEPEEELISFGDDNNEVGATVSSSASQEGGEVDGLFDDYLLFAEVSLTDSGENGDAPDITQA